MYWLAKRGGTPCAKFGGALPGEGLFSVIWLITGMQVPYKNVRNLETCRYFKIMSVMMICHDCPVIILGWNKTLTVAFHFVVAVMNKVLQKVLASGALQLLSGDKPFLTLYNHRQHSKLQLPEAITVLRPSTDSTGYWLAERIIWDDVQLFQVPCNFIGQTDLK